ncbi:hypothetical protein [Arthrobacter oryzae]|uniref:hypothetical protein n=1 Tax=Arthrobacter oryzae TaxID=409290 RepID=UPI0030C9DF23
MIFLIPLAGILLWIALFVVALLLLGIIWSVLGLLVGLEKVWHWLVSLKKAASSKRKAPRGASRRNAARGPSGPKPPLKPAGSSKRSNPPGPEQAAAETRVASDIWPRWTPSRRRDVDQELALWQEQFDALISPK